MWVQDEGWSHVIVDAKIVDADRCRARTTSGTGDQIDVWYSGKKHDSGANIQAVMRPDGFPVRVGDVEPGSVHDLTCAREHAPGARYAFPAGGLPTRADPGYEGAGIGVHTPARHRLPTQNRPNRESRSGAHPIRAPIHNSLRSAH